MIEPCIGSNGR